MKKFDALVGAGARALVSYARSDFAERSVSVRRERVRALWFLMREAVNGARETLAHPGGRACPAEHACRSARVRRLDPSFESRPLRAPSRFDKCPTRAREPFASRAFCATSFSATKRR